MIPPDDTSSLRSATQDWITLWQSEMTGRALDRDSREWLAHAAARWGGMLRAAAERLPGPRDGVGTAGADAPAGAAAAGDASGAGELAELRARVAELERRLSG